MASRAAATKKQSPEAALLEREREQLEAERAAFEAEADKRAEEVEAAEQKLEAERARLGQLAAELKDETDPEFERTERLLAAIRAAGGGGKIKMRVKRKVDGAEDNELPMILLAEGEIADYRDMVNAKHDGGSFWVEFRKPGGQMLGTDSFTFEGPPKLIQAAGPASSAAAPTPAGPTPLERELMAKLAERDARDKAEAEAARLAALLEAAVAPLARKLEALESAKAAAPVVKPEPSALEAIAIAQFQAEQKARIADRGAPSAEVTALMSKLEAQSVEIKELVKEGKRRDEEARKAEQKRREDSVDKRLADLAALITEKAKVEPDPFMAFLKEKQKLELFAESVKPKDGPRSKAIDRAIDRMTDRFGESLMPVLDKKVDGIISAVLGTPSDGKPTEGAAKDKKPEDPAKFGAWLLSEFKKGFTIVSNKTEIGKMLADFPDHMNKLAAVKTRAMLVDLLTEVAGYTRAQISEALTEGEWAKADPKLHELRATVKLILDELDEQEAKAKREAEKKKADAKAAETDEDDEDEEENEGGEDEDEEEEGDEDEGEADEPAEAEAPGAAAPGVQPKPSEPPNGSEPV